ncbi:MAG: PIN domain-containing protein [Methylobacterium frigidaeris]
MMYLLDTNILSQAAPTKEQGPTFVELADWLEAAADRPWLSVVTIAEIAAGIERLDISGHHRKGARLLDRDMARRAGVLSARARMAGSSPGFADAALAATAELRGLRLLEQGPIALQSDPAPDR